MSDSGTQSSYQRWEMASLAGEGRATPKRAETKKPAAPEALTKILEDARIEGFKKGYAKGLEGGYEAGLQQAEEVRQQLAELTTSFQSALRQADEAMAETLLTLALDVARAMLKRSLDVDREQVLPVVREAIRYLPAVKKPARLLLHPHDAATVRRHLADELAEGGWQVVEDAAIERGGCVLDSASNQIDASNATRWKRICEALGQPGEWLQQDAE